MNKDTAVDDMGERGRTPCRIGTRAATWQRIHGGWAKQRDGTATTQSLGAYVVILGAASETSLVMTELHRTTYYMGNCATTRHKAFILWS